MTTGTPRIELAPCGAGRWGYAVTVPGVKRPLYRSKGFDDRHEAARHALTLAGRLDIELVTKEPRAPRSKRAAR